MDAYFVPRFSQLFVGLVVLKKNIKIICPEESRSLFVINLSLSLSPGNVNKCTF